VVNKDPILLDWLVIVVNDPTKRVVDAETMTVALGQWSAAGGAVYRQLAEAVKDAVVRGDLLTGSRLPSERALAQQLAVSRSTILAAFELLKREGWLVSRQGSGTWLERPDAPRDAAPGDEHSARSLRANAFLRPGPAAPIDLATAALPAAPALAEVLGGLDAAAIEPLLAGHGYLPTGYTELRERVAAAFRAEGVATDADEVLVTTGTQQALMLCAGVALRPGDVALVEDPTAPGVLDALRAVGADVRAVPVGPDGPRMDELAALMTRLSPRAAFLIPTFQSPTGAVMPRAHRRRVAALARRLQVLVVEDLSHASVVLDEDPPPPIAAFGDDHVLSVGSMSKLFWGGLRVGWIRAPRHLIARLTRLKATADLGTPLLSQVASARLLERAEEVAAARRALLVARRDRLAEALAERLPSWSWRPPGGGLSAWIELPHGDAATFAQLAQRMGVVVVPGPLLSPNESSRRHLRITFAAGLATLDEGVARLAQAWEIYRPREAAVEPAVV
jgi:DNA-binding transcriptional MocR family regulator